MKRWIIALVLVAITAGIVRVIVLARSDDYSVTKHAVAKLLPGLGIDLTGEVVIRLPPGSRIESIACSDDKAIASHNGSVADIALGYSWSTIEVVFADVGGDRWRVDLDVKKENNWSQIEVDGSAPSAPDQTFEVTRNDPSASVLVKMSPM